MWIYLALELPITTTIYFWSLHTKNQIVFAVQLTGLTGVKHAWIIIDLFIFHLVIMAASRVKLIRHTQLNKANHTHSQRDRLDGIQSIQ